MPPIERLLLFSVAHHPIQYTQHSDQHTLHWISDGEEEENKEDNEEDEDEDNEERIWGKIQNIWSQIGGGGARMERNGGGESESVSDEKRISILETGTQISFFQSHVRDENENFFLSILCFQTRTRISFLI